MRRVCPSADPKLQLPPSLSDISQTPRRRLQQHRDDDVYDNTDVRALAYIVHTWSRLREGNSCVEPWSSRNVLAVIGGEYESLTKQVNRNASIVRISVLFVYSHSAVFQLSLDGATRRNCSLGFGLGGLFSKCERQFYSKYQLTSRQSSSRKHYTGHCQKLQRSILCNVWTECAWNTFPSLDCTSKWHRSASTQLLGHPG